MSQRPKDIFTLFIYNPETSAWVNYSDGIIDVDIKRGAQEYKGPFTQSDVGQMIVKTRSMEVDPYQNPLVRYNNQIRIVASAEGNIPNSYASSTIFSGFIEGIGVEYRPKSEDSIVTITAIDVIGQLYKHVISEEFIALQESWTMNELLTAIDTEEEFSWLNGVPFTVADRPAYAVGAINSNTTAWDALTIRAKTDLGFLSARRGTNHISYVSSDKDSPNNPYNLSVFDISNLNIDNGNFISQPFKSDGTGQSYKSIQISDGFERVVNDLTVKGFQSDVRSTNDNSVNIWRKTQANVNVSTNDIEDMQAIANEVLQEMSEPIREIFSITFDARKYPLTGLIADMNRTINIVHEVNESLNIDRKYSIIGINHKIDYETWDVTFQLRNIAYQDSSIDNPIISVSPSSGTTATDFTFGYTISNPELIVSQEWDLDEGFTSTSASPTANYATGGTKTITLTLLTIYGYTITSTVTLEVSGALPTGVINHSVDGAGIYSFSFSGDPATTYYWQFGNGKSSNSPTPTTYYDTAGSITVSLAVTNIYGTATFTKNISVVQSTNIPIRYVKFKVKDAWRSAEEILNLGNLTTPFTEFRFAAESYHYTTLQYISINSASGGRLTNPTLIDFKEYSNCLTHSKWERNNYARSARVTEEDFMNNVFGPINQIHPTMYIMSYNAATPQRSVNGTHVGMEFTVDLGQEYLDITSIALKHNTNGPNGYFEVEVSQDNILFKDAGILDVQFNHTNPVNFTGTFPVPRSAVTSTDDMAQVRKFRYIKVRTSDINVATENWYISEMFPFTGDWSWYLKPAGNPNPSYWPPKNVFTYAGPALTDSNTGTNITLVPEGTSGGILPTDTGSRIFATVSTPKLNDMNQASGYTWQEQFGSGDGTLGGEKTFIYDTGEIKTNIHGLYVNVKNAFGSPVSTNSNFALTIHTSEDGLSWDALGTYSIKQNYVSGLFGEFTIQPSTTRPLYTADNGNLILEHQTSYLLNTTS
jgi:PKD repeat protein